MIYHFKNLISGQIHNIEGIDNAKRVAKLIIKDKRDNDFLITTSKNNIIINNNLTIKEL